MHGVRAAQIGFAHFRQSDHADFAFLYQVRQCANRVLDRHIRIRSVHVVEINHVCLQALQAGLAGGLYAFRPRVQRPLATIKPQHTFAGEEITVPPILQGLPDQLLAAPEAVERCRVEKVVAEVQRAHEQALGIRLIHRRAIRMRNVHATKANRVNLPVSNTSFRSHALGPYETNCSRRTGLRILPFALRGRGSVMKRTFTGTLNAAR